MLKSTAVMPLKTFAMVSLENDFMNAEIKWYWIAIVVINCVCLFLILLTTRMLSPGFLSGIIHLLVVDLLFLFGYAIWSKLSRERSLGQRGPPKKNQKDGVEKMK